MGNILVATKETQGKRKSDFSWTDEGEPVHFGFECDRDKREGIDGGCGCRRSMSGLKSHKATTTFKVAQKNGTDLVRMLKSFYIDAWHFDAEEAEKMAKEEAEELERLANDFPVGSILEKRGNTIKSRILGKGRSCPKCDSPMDETKWDTGTGYRCKCGHEFFEDNGKR